MPSAETQERISKFIAHKKVQDIVSIIEKLPRDELRHLGVAVLSELASTGFLSSTLGMFMETETPDTVNKMVQQLSEIPMFPYVRDKLTRALQEL